MATFYKFGTRSLLKKKSPTKKPLVGCHQCQELRARNVESTEIHFICNFPKYGDVTLTICKMPTDAFMLIVSAVALASATTTKLLSCIIGIMIIRSRTVC